MGMIKFPKIVSINKSSYSQSIEPIVIIKIVHNKSIEPIVNPYFLVVRRINHPKNHRVLTQTPGSDSFSNIRPPSIPPISVPWSHSAIDPPSIRLEADLATAPVTSEFIVALDDGLHPWMAKSPREWALQPRDGAQFNPPYPDHFNVKKLRKTYM